MIQSSLIPRAARYLFYLAFKSPFVAKRWHWLRYYPPITPNDALLVKWSQSEWPDYQRWIDRHTIHTCQQWQSLRRLATPPGPKISIVTPVYNTDPEVLKECILSVRMQTSPYWEWLLIDDASQNRETRSVLASPYCRDPRIRLLETNRNCPQGISAATNLGINLAQGDFIVFLDHDDRLALDAIQNLIKFLSQHPATDIVYSDRDMLSPENKRFMHLMKPGWSPENLFSGNYLFHLMAYRKSLIQQVGGLRSEYDGSQDYDLILRCMEYTDKIEHIPKVLYHWRQHSNSVALNDNAKSYAFNAGIRALEDALSRRKISGTVSEIKTLWRGNYRVQLPLPDQEKITKVILPTDITPEKYTEIVQNRLLIEQSQSYILISHQACQPIDAQAEQQLASWLTLKNIGMASGKVLGKSGQLHYAGGILTKEGKLLRPYQGFSSEEPGYMAVTAIVRNISAPNPYCVMIHRELWEQLGGFNPVFRGAHGLLDFALRGLALGWRIVYEPHAVFKLLAEPLPEIFMENEQPVFRNHWQEWLNKGDPAYNPNLSQHSRHYELAIEEDISS